MKFAQRIQRAVDNRVSLHFVLKNVFCNKSAQRRQSAKTADWSMNNDVNRVTFLTCGCPTLLTELEIDRSTIRRLTSHFYKPG